MVDVRQAIDRGDFEGVHALIAQLAAWDVEQMNDLGLPTADMKTLYYSDDVDALMARFSTPRMPFLIGKLGDGPVACGALFDAGGGIAEIQKMYVRPDCRGKGVAKALMAALVEEAQRHGYERLRLETTTFMTAAVQLYRAFGFTYATPFHPLPDGLRAITIFMERKV